MVQLKPMIRYSIFDSEISCHMRNFAREKLDFDCQYLVIADSFLGGRYLQIVFESVEVARGAMGGPKDFKTGLYDVEKDTLYIDAAYIEMIGVLNL